MNFNIFKRKKPDNVLPAPNFEDNWKQEQYEKNLKHGVEALHKVREVHIFELGDDGRGYELALDIKRNFLLEYQKQLSEKIKIDKVGNTIIIKL